MPISLAPGGSQEFRCTTTLTAVTTDPILNTAEVTGTPGFPIPNPPGGTGPVGPVVTSPPRRRGRSNNVVDTNLVLTKAVDRVGRLPEHRLSSTPTRSPTGNVGWCARTTTTAAPANPRYGWLVDTLSGPTGTCSSVVDAIGDVNDNQILDPLSAETWTYTCTTTLSGSCCPSLHRGRDGGTLSAEAHLCDPSGAGRRRGRRSGHDPDQGGRSSRRTGRLRAAGADGGAPAPTHRRPGRPAHHSGSTSSRCATRATCRSATRASPTRSHRARGPPASSPTPRFHRAAHNVGDLANTGVLSSGEVWEYHCVVRLTKADDAGTAGPGTANVPAVVTNVARASGTGVLCTLRSRGAVR